MELGNKMIGLVLGVVIAGLMLGYVFPIGLNQVNEDPTYEGVSIDEGEEVEIESALNASVTSSTADSDATIELTDTETGDTSSQTINEGDSATYELESGTANVTVNSVDSGTPNTVNADFTVDKGFGWDDGSQSIFGVLGIFLVLVPLIALTKMAMDA